MNKAILMGRLTRDVELQQTSNQVSVSKFSIAVDRKYKNQAGEKQTDFFNCVAWRNTAEFISKYFHKGSKILVTGEIQNRSYDDKDGAKRYVTEIIVEDGEFCESKQSDTTQAAPYGAPYNPSAGLPDGGAIPADDDTSLPFDL